MGMTSDISSEELSDDEEEEEEEEEDRGYNVFGTTSSE